MYPFFIPGLAQLYYLAALRGGLYGSLLCRCCLPLPALNLLTHLFTHAPSPIHLLPIRSFEIIIFLLPRLCSVFCYLTEHPLSYLPVTVLASSRFWANPTGAPSTTINWCYERAFRHKGDKLTCDSSLDSQISTSIFSPAVVVLVLHFHFLS